MKKVYKQTSKIKYGFVKLRAYQQLRDRYIDSDKHDRAVRISIDIEIARDKAFNNVYELYPKLKGRDFTVHHTMGTIELKKGTQ